MGDRGGVQSGEKNRAATGAGGADSPISVRTLERMLSGCFVPSELVLQDTLAFALARDGITFEREVRLTPEDRIDFLVGGVGIELKIDGSGHRLLRQLSRYARSPRVERLIVVTTRAHHRMRPMTLSGKRVEFAFLRGLP